MRNQWIPASNPPKEEGLHLVQVNGIYENVHFENAFALGEWFSEENAWMLVGAERWQNPPVVAWMPLPATYEEGKRMTNEEYLRNMPFNTLVEWVASERIVTGSEFCKNYARCMDDLATVTDEMCERCASEWLKEEMVKEE